MTQSDDAALLASAAELDARWPFAHRRGRFHIPRHEGADAVYLCGNSLGLQPVAAEDAVRIELDAWSRLGVDGHFDAPSPWFSYHETVAPGLARLVGASPGEVVAMGSLSANLHLLLVSFYRPTAQRYRIVIEAGAFPSDQYIVASQARFHGFDPADAIVRVEPAPGTDLIDEGDVERTLEELGDTVALVLFGGVHFRTGQAFDLGRIAAAARARGIAVGFDLAHAVGNVPLALHDIGADFAAWCSYKYLNAGPGGVAGIFVHERHAMRPDLPRFAGWWGHDPATRFAMGDDFVPQAGAAGWQLSNAPVLPLALLRASLAEFDAVGLPALRERSLALTGWLADALTRTLGARAHLVTPADPQRRGCQLSIRVPDDARAVQVALQARGVIVDFRTPDIVRVAPAPLYNTALDAARFVLALRDVLDARGTR
jgi:kynureninase